MRLVATVAHPRSWPLLERGSARLLRILLVRDPDELTSQLAAIGQDLRCQDASVLIRNEAGSGLLLPVRQRLVASGQQQQRRLAAAHRPARRSQPRGPVMDGAGKRVLDEDSAGGRAPVMLAGGGLRIAK